MISLSQLISSCACRGRNRHGERRLFAFKHRSSYSTCLKELKAAGFRPHKQLDEQGIFSLTIDKRKSLSKIARHSGIRFIEKDVKARAHGLPQTLRAIRSSSCEQGHAPWNIKQVQAPLVWPLTQGSGVRLAILDTGIAAHPDLRIAGGINTISGHSYRDDNGHGTHVAGIAAGTGFKQLKGVAPRISLYAVKVLDQEGNGYVSDIVEGIDWCIRNRMQVMNLSLGLPPGEDSQALREAVRRARRHGIVIVSSAGNEGKAAKSLDAPARYAGVIAVAASTRKRRIAGFSSRGNGLTCAAPGLNIRSTWLRGGYKIMSGTSMASPHAAGGTALLLLRMPDLTPHQISNLLAASARKLGFSVKAQGAGLLQNAKALRRAAASPTAFRTADPGSARRQRLLRKPLGSRSNRPNQVLILQNHSFIK
ncbi:S8 family peptidase [Paenibacillus tarimensis]|uniref:S8 family peptidase n=1 Tax=Paenibacillus tarimensis TaxID=416012 RepID=UPI001F25B6E3|nr:S8 family peptidase [Paenibacillus tarimensis]MCF2942469.1 S8 family peptidase [Paenibacillus tarimensis]